MKYNQGILIIPSIWLHIKIPKKFGKFSIIMFENLKKNIFLDTLNFNCVLTTLKLHW